MADRDWKKEKKEREESMGDNTMNAEEAKAYRPALAKPVVRVLLESEKREQFRIFWAQAKRNFAKSKDLENVLWAHLKSSGNDVPENFKKGILHFGLKEIKK